MTYVFFRSPFHNSCYIIGKLIKKTKKRTFYHFIKEGKHWKWHENHPNKKYYYMNKSWGWKETYYENLEDIIVEFI